MATDTTPFLPEESTGSSSTKSPQAINKTDSGSYDPQPDTQ